MKSGEVFNPDMLVIARESRGLTQTDLANAANISQGSVSKWESRLKQPTTEAASRMAKALGYPEGFFYQPEVFYGLPPTFYRRRQRVGKRVLNQLHARMTVARLHLIRLLRGVVFEPALPMLDLEVDDYGSPEDVAGVLRATWLVRPGPIPNLIGLIESAGILVIPMDLREDKIDAVGWKVPDLPPLMFVDLSVPTDRLRFTLAHELGHLIMHRVPSEDMESEADRFAGEFLAPAAELRPSLAPVTLERLARLKLVWRVSMASLLYRAGELELITPRQRQYLWTEFAKRGWRKREPGSTDIPAESPSLLKSLFATHLDKLGYSIDELASALNSTVQDLLRTYSIDCGGPRLLT